MPVDETLFPDTADRGTSMGGTLVGSVADNPYVTLTAGITYSFYAHIDNGNLAFFNILDIATGNWGGTSLNHGVGNNVVFTFTPTVSGLYPMGIVDVSGVGGPWTIEVTGVPATDHLLTTGEDIFTGTTEGERILGGLGNDTIAVGAGLDALGEQGNDTLTGNGLANFLSGGTGDDVIDGGAGDDTLFGDGGADRVYGGAGTDIIYGGAGDDLLYGFYRDIGDLGNDILHGGAGNDGLLGSDGDNQLFGDDGSDQLYALAGADMLDGGAGADMMAGGTGDDTYVVDDTGDAIVEFGGDGLDTVRSSISFSLVADGVHVAGDVENLTLTGAAAIDATGNALDNVLIGNSGDNRLDGRGGADLLFGGAGNDTYVVDNAGDVVREDTVAGTDDGGYDTVRASIAFTLGSLFEKLVLTGNAAIAGTGNGLANSLTGNGSDNVLTGLAGADRLDGRAGADTLSGGADSDTLFGGAGDDVLIGGAGGDRLIGGAGADTFVFVDGADSVYSATGRDSILDFDTSQGDRIDLSAVDADITSAGNQAFDFIGTARFTGHAGELRYTLQAGDVFIHGDTDGDGQVDFSIRLSIPDGQLTSLQAGDLIL